MNENEGVIYYAGGHQNILADAVLSAHSLKLHNPHIPCRLFHTFDPVDLENSSGVFDQLERITSIIEFPSYFKGPSIHFFHRITGMINSPFSKTLYLDTDTQVMRPLGDLFRLLDRFDVVLCPGPITQKVIDGGDVMGEVPLSFPEFNAGVILFRSNDRTLKFLRDWQLIYLNNEKDLFREHHKGGDQVSLRYLLWKNKDLKVFHFCHPAIPNLTNFRWRRDKSFYFENQIFILHGPDAKR